MNQTSPQQYADLRAFRQTIFSAICKRHDAAFNLIDALLERPKPRNIAELSLSPHCPRQWSSLYDAVEEAVVDTKTLEATYTHYALKDWQEHGEHQAKTHGLPCMVVVGDASVVRRSSCRTVDGLRYCHTQTHEVNGRGIVAGHQYQLLRYMSETHSSWAMPLANDRLGEHDTQASLGAEQLQRFSMTLGTDTPCLSVFDGAFGCASFLSVTQHQRCGVVARMRHDRALFHPAADDPRKGRGAPAVYGERFDCDDATTWSSIADYCHFTDAHHGTVVLQRWNGLRMRPTANDAEHRHRRQAPLTVDVLRCITHQGTPKRRVICLVLQQNAIPDPIWSQTEGLWRAFDARPSIEASIKVSKQECSWTMPQTFTAKAADTWTHLTEIAFWHLFLVRKHQAFIRFGWQKADAPVTPRRVRQSLSAILFAVGSPAALPLPRGNSVGWEKGRTRSKRKRYPVIYKTKKATT